MWFLFDGCFLQTEVNHNVQEMNFTNNFIRIFLLSLLVLEESALNDTIHGDALDVNISIIFYV